MLVTRIRETYVYPSQIHGPETYLLAYFEFEGSAAPVHPYIHARTVACRRRSTPPYARFHWEGKACVLYDASAHAGHFDTEQEAIDFGPRLVGLIAQTYADRDRILPDEPGEGPPKALDILRLLPRNNCRECGLATCMAFAVGVSRGEAYPWSCPSFPLPKEGRSRFIMPGGQGSRPFVLTLDHPYAPPGDARREAGEATAEPGPPEVGNLSTLTERELQVLELMALGFSNREIAENLGISPHTVKTHSVHIFEKLDCTDRTQASVWASRAGLV